VKRWALIINGEVANVTIQNTQPDVGGNWVDITGTSVGPGHRDQGDGTYAAVVVAPARHITRLAFDARFTDAEAAALDDASVGASATAKALRRATKQLDRAEYVDLDRADTRALVNQLVGPAISLSAQRKAEILDAAVQAHERFTR